MTSEALMLETRGMSTKRLEGRLRRIARDLQRETRPEELEKLRDEQATAELVLKDRATR